MALQPLVGAGLWLPTLPYGMSQNLVTSSDAGLLDADEEEVQIIGSVTIDGGGSKTFGTSGSKISWLPGASITFGTNSQLRVGVKQASSIDAGNGPAARATIGAAAFDVYKELVGGTDTITATTWRNDTMDAGTPFTVTDGDLIAICFHLNSTSGSPSVKVRLAVAPAALGMATVTLVTTGPTYTAQTLISNAILTFDDGTLGWIEPTIPFSVVDAQSATIGNGNVYANIFRVPFPCKVDAIGLTTQLAANDRDFSLELYETPLGTPALIESVAQDANIFGAIGAARFCLRRLLTPRTLAINTDYAVGIKQTTANAVTVYQRDINTAAHMKPLGMGAECYAATSTAGATFAAANSGLRRYNVWIRVSSLDDGTGSGGTTIAGTPMRRGMV